MGVLRRITGATAGILVLQLTLLGAAAPCTDHGASEQADPERTQSASQMGDVATGAGGDEDCDGTPAEPGNSESPGGRCMAMISCVPPMLQLGAQPAVAGGLVLTRLAAVPLHEPPTRTTAPELPPPRA